MARTVVVRVLVVMGVVMVMVMVVVMVVMVMIMAMFVVVRVPPAVAVTLFRLVKVCIAQVNVELHPFDARLMLPGIVKVISIQVQLLQFALELVRVHPEVDQRANEHVAADAAKKVQVQGIHCF